MNEPILHQRRRAYPTVFVPLIVVALMLVIAPAANAATTYSSTALNATVNGTAVTASTTIKASVSTAATYAGICARSAGGAHSDFPLAAATVTTAGTSFTKTKTFAAGTYTYWACVKVGGVWFNVGSSKTFTVSGTTPTSPGTGSATASGVAMPVGNLPGWKQVFADDFATDVARGSFPGPYASKWTAYDGFTDSSGAGRYSMSAISASGGAMDLYLHTENGQAISAAPAPIIGSKWKGQTYGRYTVRFKSDPIPGYKAAWLLWPDSGNWNQGEINFPEGGLSSTIFAFNHCVGNPASNCYYFDTKTAYTGWHTATVEWSPGKLTFNLDGKTGTTTSSIPTSPLHWILQTETDGGKPAASAAGHIQIDWVAAYSYTG